MASPRKSERLISSRGHGCFTINPPQLPATATRFPSHGSGRPGLVLRTATKLSSVAFEPTAVLTFGLRVRRLNHSATRSLDSQKKAPQHCTGRSTCKASLVDYLFSNREKEFFRFVSIKLRTQGFSGSYSKQQQLHYFPASKVTVPLPSPFQQVIFQGRYNHEVIGGKGKRKKMSQQQDCQQQQQQQQQHQFVNSRRNCRRCTGVTNSSSNLFCNPTLQLMKLVNMNPKSVVDSITIARIYPGNVIK